MKKTKLIILLIILSVIITITYLILPKNKEELRTIKSDKELLNIYNQKNSSDGSFLTLLSMPFGFFYTDVFIGDNGILGAPMVENSIEDVSGFSATESSTDGDTTKTYSAANSKKDYSTTNIQVENVDEADITKTDGDYIYSISDNNVIITNVINPEDIKIEATITSNDKGIPEDLILFNNKLIVIYAITGSSTYYSKNTSVKIYNIENKSKPNLIKKFELYEPYYTSRCINNQLYVIASGELRAENNKIVRAYKEDSSEKVIPFKNIKYLKDVKTTTQTIISNVDLDNIKSDININSYLIDVSNAYVSEKNIYLLKQNYEYDSDMPSLSDLFGLKGVIGLFDNFDDSNSYKTEIYKFNILKDGQVSYHTKNKIDGKTINQYSLDEKNEHLRIALFDSNGARVAILDENLNPIGISKNVAKGEKMYSSRFMGNKAYFVTYQTIDPLFVIDLSNEANPVVLGELHIPGYSTYLHPYDENHLIGIGMETEEVVNRNSLGNVISTTSKIIGMKMALFDVSDVNHPIEMSHTVIGDRRTTSAILSNPKALLFSKEKQLIAIPVNNYNEDFEIASQGDTYSSIINSYKYYTKTYNAEGYFVYKINLEDGFNLKGIVTHETLLNNKTYYSYNTKSKLLRGLYIDNNLYTISETAVKVNNLDTMALVDELKIK